MKNILNKILGLVFLSLIIETMISQGVVAFDAKFSPGDVVEVVNTLDVGLFVRDSPCGNIIGKKYDGDRGMIIEGPEMLAFDEVSGIVYTWWYVRWETPWVWTDGYTYQEGWCAEGYPGSVDYLQKVYIPPSIKFQIGDDVAAYPTDGFGLTVRSEPPMLEDYWFVSEGTLGKIIDGPFYGVPRDQAGFYYFWKVDYGSVVGWCAEDWLTKVVGEPVITSSLVIAQPPPYYVGETITAEFTITNRATVPFFFDVITVGGRDPDGQVADFSWIMEGFLTPGQSFNYKGFLTLTKAGYYHFFCAYRTADGNWNTAIPTEEGITNVLDIYVNPAATVKILPVPYYSQRDLNWCIPNSMSMIFKYYGLNVHSWDIAKDWGWSRYVNWFESWDTLPWNVEDYFNNHGLATNIYYIKLSPPSFQTIKDWIDQNMPILLSMNSIDHAVVIIGYSSQGESKKVYINDPSGHLINDHMKLSKYPCFAVEVDWNELTNYMDTFSWLIAVEGTPQPPKGTIDLHDYGTFFFNEMGGRVYSWLYGLNKGLIWKNSPNHSLALSSEDKFMFYDEIVNHMEDDQAYTLEIVFAVYDPSTTLWVPFSTLRRDISIEGYTSKAIKVGSYSLRYLFSPGYGEYRIILRLWNKELTELYDEIVFPSLEYKPLAMFYLYSPANFYITDPWGRHIGVDPSTGQIVNNIPGAVYTGPESEPEVITIPDPIDGNYDVQLIGTATGNYSLTMELISQNTTVYQTYFGEINKNETRYYTASVSIETYEMEVISWGYVFNDENQGTVLKISTDDRLFQFITPDKDYGIRQATCMRIYRTTIISYCNEEIRLISVAVPKFDFCIAVVWDKQTQAKYFLIDKIGHEN